MPHIHAECPYHMPLPHVHAACPCRMSMPNVHAECPCCMFMLHVLAACFSGIVSGSACKSLRTAKTRKSAKSHSFFCSRRFQFFRTLFFALLRSFFGFELTRAKARKKRRRPTLLQRPIALTFYKMTVGKSKSGRKGKNSVNKIQRCKGVSNTQRIWRPRDFLDLA
jgi:hypothetical protein